MKILGLNAFHADSAACLFIDGRLICAAEEERFRRIKHWAGFPAQAIEFCLTSQNLQLEDIDVIAINTDPKAAKAKRAKYLLSGQASIALLKEKLLVRKKRKGIEQYLSEAFPDQVFTGKVEYVEHHLAHLASAYNVSPFSQANVVSVDGFGDFCSMAWGVGQGENIVEKDRVYFPHSLGIFYQALTQFLGFPHYGDEYKVMGLAPYGKPVFAKQMDEILKYKRNGQFELNLKYFRHHKQSIGIDNENNSPEIGVLYTDKLYDLFSIKRLPNEPIEQVHKDIAHSIQNAYERAFFHLLNYTHKKNPSDNLTIAGGCGMNSVANGKVHLQTPYKNIYIQSAAGDAGGAIGAAVVAGQRHGVSEIEQMTHSYWGPSFSDHELSGILNDYQTQLVKVGCCVDKCASQDILSDKVSDAIVDGKVIGWFQGAMEWGPRALGNRSILGDPRRTDMKDILNLKIKRRESFRPFAPSVLREHVNEWFESDADVPFMMKVFQIHQQKRAAIPAVAHVDGSGRLQTVTAQSNPAYYQLINSFYQKTGVPMLLNTSFNENEPVVCKPQEALDCFLRTNMDVLVLGSHLIQRQ